MCLNFPALDYFKQPAALKTICISISIYYMFKTENMDTLKYMSLYFSDTPPPIRFAIVSPNAHPKYLQKLPLKALQKSDVKFLRQFFAFYRVTMTQTAEVVGGSCL